MPMLQIKTNVPKENITPEILQGLSEVLSSTLGKATSYCMVRIVPDQLMIFGGTDEPCAVALLTSIGKLGAKENKVHAKAIYEYVEKHLKIPGDRMYLEFNDKQTSDIGFKGTTFQEILGR